MPTPEQLGIFTSSFSTLELAAENRMKDLVRQIAEQQKNDPKLIFFLKKLVDKAASKLSLGDTYEFIEMLIDILKENRMKVATTLSDGQAKLNEAIDAAEAAE